jgi:hypothetical protein
MPREPVAVREVDWLELFPWLGLARAIHVALDPRKILLAIVGLLLTSAGWWTLAGLYRPSEPAPEQPVAKLPDVTPATTEPLLKRPPAKEKEPATALDRQVDAGLTSSPWAKQPPVRFGLLDGRSGFQWSHSLRDIPPAWYVYPFSELFGDRVSLKGVSLALLYAVWMLLVWAFCGGAITRLAALRLAQDRRTSLWRAGRHAVVKWRAYVFAPAFPLGGTVLLLVLPAAVAGLLARSEILFAVIGWVVWPLGLVLSLIAGVLLVALAVGWPLMWATISAEATDAFDAFSRSFSYVTQRPFHLVFYVVVAAVLGAIGWAFVSFMAELTFYLSVWGLSWGLGQVDSDKLLKTIEGSPSQTAGASALLFWRDFLWLIVIGFGHSFFWTAASGIYFLLRRDTDATPLEDVHLDEGEDPYGLPPVTRDRAGVPTLETPEPAASKA